MWIGMVCRTVGWGRDVREREKGETQKAYFLARRAVYDNYFKDIRQVALLSYCCVSGGK